MQIVVNLPEETYLRARRLAQLTQRELDEVLADTLELSLPALGQSNITDFDGMSDEEIRQLADFRLNDVDAADRCGYCLSPQNLVLGRLELDHTNSKRRHR